TTPQILKLIDTHGSYAFGVAAANIDVARARLDEANSALYPRVSLDATGQRYQSTQKWQADDAEIYGALEVVQPIYDFGKSGSEIDAAVSEVAAAEQAMITARNTVLLEGLALFFELHASELQLRAFNEIHASAYVSWDRAKEQLGIGRASPVDVAEALALVEKTRLDYFRERSHNFTYRIRLEELIAQTLPAELISPPKPPEKAPIEVDREAFSKIVIARNPEMVALLKQVDAAAARRGGISSLPSVEAFGNVGHSSRDLRGRNEYAVGARLSWSIFDGGIKGAQRNRLAAEESRLNARLELKRRQLRLKSYKAIMERNDSFQRVVSARAGLEYASKNLLRRQQLYSQERVADLGRAMIENSQAESELIRATGAFRLELARIAMLLGDHPGKGLESGYMASIMGTNETPGEDYIPKGGSGFGQEDQDKVNRKVE
ncbi:MAG: TolC family protein, partial [Rhodospirillaceae bacterium]|nr:TolC family protein [Rhodospirillaceae bacterium]